MRMMEMAGIDQQPTKNEDRIVQRNNEEETA